MNEDDYFLSVLASNNSARSPICILYINSGIYICMCVYITILFTNHPRMYTHAFILVVSILCVFEGTLRTFFWIRRGEMRFRERVPILSSTRLETFQPSDSLFRSRARVSHLSLSLSLSFPFLQLTPQRFLHLSHRRSSILPEKALLPPAINHP
jgi:hypothetical protein